MAISKRKISRLLWELFMAGKQDCPESYGEERVEKIAEEITKHL